MAVVRMLALKSFDGAEGESLEPGKKHIKRNVEFHALDEHRADDYERLGLAQRVTPKEGEAKPARTTRNAAASAGPTRAAGGRTGGASVPSSSQRVRQQPQRGKSSTPARKGRRG